MSAFHTPSTVAFDNMSWFELLQIFSTLGAAINFGGSALQSPLIMPAMQDEVVPVPVHYTAQSTAYLLHNSEHFFPHSTPCARSPTSSWPGPPTTTATGARSRPPSSPPGRRRGLEHRHHGVVAGHPGADEQAHGRAGRRAQERSREGSGKEASHKAVENEFRALQKRWIVRNYGRATIMITAALTGAVALVTRA
ncbi:hypothetical protein H2203_002456 [Taxawa tesnikishii (nom. ined.)]|nr:hypothetical protein H2203_002456 [Dothideales sp. JES 119]